MKTMDPDQNTSLATLKSSSFLFLLGVILLIGSFAVDTYIFLYVTGEAGLIGDVKWITHILGIVFAYLGYRRK
ncbi:MAG: hypothetical protein ACXACG_02710 [Candidatus Thorarchaeota archaeon]|jgi:hypothetical protein